MLFLLLLFLNQNHEKVMGLMSGLLSQVVHLTSQQGSLRFRLAAKAADVSRRIDGNKFRCSDETYRTFRTLRHLLEFFDKYHAGDYVRALEVRHLKTSPQLYCSV